MALPSFGLTKSAPFQGISDKNWTKYQEYPPQFRQIMEKLNWGEEISLDTPVPHEEAQQIRLAWYNLKRFVMRARDLDAFFDWRARHIQCKVILQADRITAIVQWICDSPQPNSTRNQGIQRMNLAQPTRVGPPAIANPGMQPPGFESPQQFDDSLNPESEYSKGIAEMEAEMKRIEAEGNAWRLEQDNAIEVQDSVRLYFGNYDRFKLRYTREEYERLLQLDTSKRRSDQDIDAKEFTAKMVQRNAFANQTPQQRAGIQKLMSVDAAELERCRKINSGEIEE